MRRRYLSLVSVLGLLAVGCGGESYETEEMTVYSRNLEKVAVDQAAKGQSVGDSEAFSLELYKTLEGGEPVGIMDGVATIARTQTTRGQRVGHRVATVQYSFAGLGTVVSAGVYSAEIPGDGSQPVRQLVRPIVGGTDAYANARGKVVQTAIGGGQQKITLVV